MRQIDDRISVGNIYNSGGCICYTGGDESQVKINNKYIRGATSEPENLEQGVYLKFEQNRI